MHFKLLFVSKFSALNRRLKRLLSLVFPSRYRAIYSSEKHLCDFDGVKLILDLSAPAHRIIYTQGSFEPETTAILCNIFRPSEVFVDIGANIGWHTLSLLVKRSDVLMSYAYEPSKQAFALLNEGIIANNCEDRCYARRLAIADKKGTATLKTFIGLDPMHASLYPLADLPYEEEEVEIDTLDSQAETFLAAPAVIKCDVEGAELDVLMGAKGILSGKFGPPPIWLLEANYETSGMVGFFPWQMIEVAVRYAPYQGYYIRNGYIIPLPNRTALRHGEMLILAIPELHQGQLEKAALRP